MAAAVPPSASRQSDLNLIAKTSDLTVRVAVRLLQRAAYTGIELLHVDCVGRRCTRRNVDHLS